MDDFGGSDVSSVGDRNNLSFTDTLPIDHEYDSNLRSSSIEVQALDGDGGGGGDPDPNSDPVVAGNITETINGIKATDIDIEGSNGALCERTAAGFTCQVPASASNPRIKFLAYGGNNKTAYVCLTGNALTLVSEVTEGVNSHAVYELHDASGNPWGSGFDVNVQDTICPGGGLVVNYLLSLASTNK